MDVAAFTPRPTSITSVPTDDGFFIDVQGKVNFQVNSPYWVPGASEVITPQPYAALRVGVSWASDASALRVFALCLNADLKTCSLYVNAMVPGVWVLGGWDRLINVLPLPT
jgi:hypothetical protein